MLDRKLGHNDDDDDDGDDGRNDEDDGDDDDDGDNERGANTCQSTGRLLLALLHHPLFSHNGASLCSWNFRFSSPRSFLGFLVLFPSVWYFLALVGSFGDFFGTWCQFVIFSGTFWVSFGHFLNATMQSTGGKVWFVSLSLLVCVFVFV